MTKKHQALNARMRRNKASCYWVKKGVTSKAAQKECLGYVLDDYRTHVAEHHKVKMMVGFVKWKNYAKFMPRSDGAFIKTRIVKLKDLAKEGRHWGDRYGERFNVGGIKGTHVGCQCCEGRGVVYGHYYEEVDGEPELTCGYHVCEDCSGSGTSSFIVLDVEKNNVK